MQPVSLAERLLAQHESRPYVPPAFAEWLRFWNDDVSDFENLRDLEHWLKQAQTKEST